MIFTCTRMRRIRVVCFGECVPGTERSVWRSPDLQWRRRAAIVAIAQLSGRPRIPAIATLPDVQPPSPTNGGGALPARRNLGSSPIVAMAARSAQLGLVAVVAFLCVVSAAGNGENEAGAMVSGIPTRHLLQTVQPCPEDFATQNYTQVTSVCNATNLNMPVCCAAFVNFACPFATYINDANTNCNVAMFTYLNMAGGYSEQTFTMCQGDSNGLPCPLVPEPSPNPSSATMDMPWRLPTLVIFLVTLVHLVRYS